MKYVALTWLALIALAVWLHKHGDYMVEHRTPVTILAKYLPAGGYKSSTAPVLVLRTDDGRVFDTYTSFATYTLYGKGDRIVLSLRRMDILQTGRENALYFAGPVICMSIGLVMLFVSVVAGGVRGSFQSSGSNNG